MKRVKRHKVKTEAPETSSSHNREQEVHDLAYYIHDRVELMHQVFSVIKYKELKAMVPASIRNISIDDLQELCTEELLGISSKRLCAILDGADPPSDTESSSPSPPPEQMETISLDSISSDDEILSQSSSKKKKHKHRRHSRSKSKRKKSKEQEEGEADKSKASRAGLTVLELLELQARARAIRAQLQQEQQNKSVSETASKEPPHSSDNEVEIKEEPAEVVEISSDEEKPKVEELQKKIIQEKEKESDVLQQPATATKQIKDLVITVPQKTKQKIKLNRSKSTSVSTDTNSVASNNTSVATAPKPDPQSVATTKNVDQTPEKREEGNKNVTKKDKPRKKKKDKKNVSKDDIDNDEITLQLSDTEKMDLLEDLDRKNYDSVSSCSDSSSESSDSDENKEEKKNKDKEKDSSLKEENKTPEPSKECEENKEEVTAETEKIEKDSSKKDLEDIGNESPVKATSEIATEDCSQKTELNASENNINVKDDKMDTEIVHLNTNNETNLDNEAIIVEDLSDKDPPVTLKDNAPKDTDTTPKDTPMEAKKDEEKESKDNDNNLSEGELSDRESSEIEAVDLKPEVVCISDEEGSKKAKKKKKKKEKKSKKDKKSKNKDFRESADQNFYKDVIEDTSQEEIENPTSIEVIDNTNINKLHTTEIKDKVDLTTDYIANKLLKEQIIDEEIKPELPTDNPALPDDDIEAVYEIMELSDDSSCCEVECTILSKEPTASEIEALSAKIDEMDRFEIITDKEIREYEKQQEKKDDLDAVSNISWKDRYLDSTKVKRVLNTANILNAIRKKNRDLKKKLAESKNEEECVPQVESEKEDNTVLEEGTIDHYNTLETSNKYVDPIKEVSKDLKKDAKLLLKMYKKLLKYNDMNKPEDPAKKKKKKRKKIKKDNKNRDDGKDMAGNKDGFSNSEVSLSNKDLSVESTEEFSNKRLELDNK